MVRLNIDNHGDKKKSAEELKYNKNLNQLIFTGLVDFLNLAFLLRIRFLQNPRASIQILHPIVKVIFTMKPYLFKIALYITPNK